MIDPQETPVDNRDIPAPPRFLLWGAIGLLLLAIIGVFAGLYIFRNVLTTGQQYRIVTLVPFMEALMPARSTPEGGIIPTAEPQANPSLSALDLLNMPLVNPTETPVITEEAVSETTPAALAPTVTPTPEPTAAPTETPLPTPTELVSETNAQPANTTLASSPAFPPVARLYGFRHEQQTWNNCGPANITMALSYYGWKDDQAVAATYLKPGGREDKNVSPWEMVAFVNEKTGVRALSRIGGDLDLLKTLIANEFPVIIETGYMPEGYDWIGHYQTIVGYDDLQRLFYIYDSFLGSGENGEGISESYDKIDRGWQAFNRTFIVLYERSREAEVAALLGTRADVTQAAEHALIVAQQEARAAPHNAFTWFNMGTSLARLNRFEEAAIAFDKARQAELPFRMLWYQFDMFESYLMVGRYNDVLSLADVNITNGASDVEETYYWMGQAYLKKGQTQQAADAFRLALRRNPRYEEARAALAALS